MKSIKAYFIGLITLLCVSCSNTSGLWLGEDKKEKLPGERIAIIPETKSLEVDKVYQKHHVSIPKEQNIDIIDKSTGIDSSKYPNLKLGRDLAEYRSYSFTSNRLFASTTVPIFINDKMILLGTNGDLIAYQLNSKIKLWENRYFSKKAGKGLISFSTNFYEGGLSFSNNVIYVTAGLNEVIALNADTGELIWSKVIGSPTRSTPLILVDKIIVQTTDNNAYALNINSGEIIWTYLGIKGEVSMISTASPIVSNNTLIIQQSTGTLVGIDAVTGNEVWSFEITSELERLSIQQQVHDVIHKPLIDGHNIIAYGNDGIIGAFSLRDGQSYWKKNLGVNRPVWVCGELLIAITKSKELIAVNKNDGRVKWFVDLTQHENTKSKAETIWLEPIVANGKVTVVNSQGRLFEFDVNTGMKLNDVKVEENVYLAPLVVNEKLYLISGKGRIVEYKEK
jgi:outer membrane protein assembly factor BamB